MSSITVTVVDCTPEVRHDNYSDRHFEDDLWQLVGWVEPLRIPALPASVTCCVNNGSFRCSRLMLKKHPSETKL